MLTASSTPDGFVTNDMVEFYRSFARGGAGIVTVGDSSVDYDYARGHPGELNLGDNRVIGGLSTLVEAIQRYGAKASIQLNHRGMLVPPLALSDKNPIGPSRITVGFKPAEELQAGVVTRRVQTQEMDQDMIDMVIEQYASACYRCLMAGFEMVMIHGGHGHLLPQFVSPYSNKRTDAYGGSLENRARFVIEVLTAIRSRVGNRLTIEYRISGDELVPGGMHLDETIEFIKMIQDKIDLINVSVSLMTDPRYIKYMIQPSTRGSRRTLTQSPGDRRRRGWFSASSDPWKRSRDTRFGSWGRVDCSSLSQKRIQKNSIYFTLLFNKTLSNFFNG